MVNASTKYEDEDFIFWMSGFGPLEEACERAGDQTEDQAQVHERLKGFRSIIQK